MAPVKPPSLVSWPTFALPNGGKALPCSGAKEYGVQQVVTGQYPTPSAACQMLRLRNIPSDWEKPASFIAMAYDVSGGLLSSKETGKLERVSEKKTSSRHLGDVGREGVRNGLLFLSTGTYLKGLEWSLQSESNALQLVVSHHEGFSHHWDSKMYFQK